MSERETFGPLDPDAAEHEAAKLENERLQRQQEEIAIYKILNGAAVGTVHEVIHKDGSASYYQLRADGSMSEKPDLFLDSELREKYLTRITTMIEQMERGITHETETCPECGSPMVKDVKGSGQWRWICPNDRTVLQP